MIRYSSLVRFQSSLLPFTNMAKGHTLSTCDRASLKVPGDPYTFEFPLERTALMVIDMQADFCTEHGYCAKMGYDVSPMQRCIPRIQALLREARRVGLWVVHTREGHRADLADCPANKLRRSRAMGAGIGERGALGRILVRGEAGWEIVPELRPAEGEAVVDKPGKGSFYATDLDLLLRRRGVTHLIMSGVTTDVCVHTTMREANDRGYECLLLNDCTAATDPGNHASAIKMVQMQGGVFGTVSDSTRLIESLSQI